MEQGSIFITGANGQLGTALREKYPEAKFADIDTLDITDEKSVAAFDWSSVEVLINAAAYTNVDGAETLEGQKAAQAVNADAVKNLARIAKSHDLALVHISTDYVFDGTKSSYTEGDALNPLSVYGKTKAAGDTAAAFAPKHYILRTSWVIGEGKNFVHIMAGLAEKNISPSVVNDQIGRLTFTSTLVEAIDHLLKTGAPYGIYNVTNSGEPASWADITRVIFHGLGRDDLNVTNVTTAEYYKDKSGIAPRPLHSTLDLAKIEATGFKPNDWRDDLKQYLKGQN